MVRIPKIRNWRRIVGDLKSGPDFGIHGPRKNTLYSIINSNQLIINCHYFGVTSKEKELNDEDFYNKLWCSISESSLFSYSFKLKNNQAIFDGNPNLMLGTNHITLDSGEVSNIYGHTFKVGHCFLRKFGKIYGIELKESELEKVNENLKDFIKKSKYYGRYSDIIESYYILEQINKRFISKIHKELK